MQIDATSEPGSNPVFKDRLSWYFGVSAYWFATSFKWFMILGTLVSGQLFSIIPKGKDNAAWGMVFTIGAIWALFGPAFFGSVSDRFLSKYGRRKPFLVYGTVATVIALAILANSTQFWMFIVGYLILQIADDIGTGPYAALIPEIIPESHRGRASSVLALLRLVSNICGGVTAMALTHVGYTYTLIGALQVVCVGLVLWQLRDFRDGKSTAKVTDKAKFDLRGFFRGWVEPWRRYDFRMVWFLTFTVTLGFYLVQPYLKNYLRDSVVVFNAFGYLISDADPESAAQKAYGLLALVVSVFGALGSVWAYRLSDKKGRKWVMKIAGPITFLPLIPFALVPNYSAMLVFAPFFGFGYGVFLSASWALASDIVAQGEEQGRDMGLWQASWSSTQIVAGLFGWVIDGLNRFHKGWGYSAVILVAAALFGVGSALVQRVKGAR
ncbi:MAG: MFS transporter [Fimbriimonadaceae bacterium]|nr:MFS transporter [Fimbriimonadaceae bacterium]